MVLKPFSFIFLLQSKNEFHIAWETLDTQEATYIWSFPQGELSAVEMLKQVNETIKKILRDGRNAYKAEKEKKFKRAFHDYIDLKNGFDNWKVEIESAITR